MRFEEMKKELRVIEAKEKVKKRTMYVTKSGRDH